MPAKRFNIPWKYCDCGCKSSCVTIGGLYFSYHDDLRGTLWFSTSHHPFLTGVKVKSYAEIDRRVRQALKPQKAELARQMAELEGL